ncbi:hypothetical protein V5799_002963 [Amblyomma americanum]|uniref:Uncharacterized protein n=1 Tax=Amblyomma americanum TaxID=6943 RepID=A0AAQ4DAB5_AMBAM
MALTHGMSFIRTLAATVDVSPSSPPSLCDLPNLSSSASEKTWRAHHIPVAVVPPQSRHPSEEPSSITKGLLPDSIDHEFGVDAGSQLSLLKQSSV